MPGRTMWRSSIISTMPMENPLTASDIVFSFESAIATKNYSKLNVVESVTALDDYNVELSLTKIGDR